MASSNFKNLVPGWYIKSSFSPPVDFINIKRANFLYKRRFSSYVLALSKNVVQKIRTFNVDEIDTSSKFHQR